MENENVLIKTISIFELSKGERDEKAWNQAIQLVLNVFFQKRTIKIIDVWKGKSTTLSNIGLDAIKKKYLKFNYWLSIVYDVDHNKITELIERKVMSYERILLLGSKEDSDDEEKKLIDYFWNPSVYNMNPSIEYVCMDRDNNLFIWYNITLENLSLIRKKMGLTNESV